LGPPAGRVPASELTSAIRHDDYVVREVGDVEILASDVFRIVDLVSPTVVDEVLPQLVLSIIARQEARRLGLDLPSEQLEDQIDLALETQRTQFALQGNPDMSLEQFLQSFYDMSPADLRAETRRMVMSSMVLERLVRLGQWSSARDELQIIMVEEHSLALEIEAKLQEGASFSVLAKQHSLHPSASAGGFMSPLSDAVAQPLARGRKTLEVDGVLGPAPITVGDKDFWRFLRLVDRLPAVQGSWDELRDRLEQDLEQRPMNSEELAGFEARMRDLYRVRQPPRTP
jgi:parvulin-like peptidyl-prolyl isomerase